MEESRAVPSRHRTCVRAILGLLLVLQFGCAFPGFGPPTISPEERAAYDSAMGHLPANPRATEAALRDFVAAYPKSPLADDAAEQLSELAFAAGREEDGLRWLGWILSETPDGDRAAAARLRLATYEYARNKLSTARRLLAPLELEDLSLSDQRSALRLREKLAQTPVERLTHLGALRSTIEAEIRERSDEPETRRRLAGSLVVVDQEIRELLRRAAPAELEAMLRDQRGKPTVTLVLFELTRRALASGELEDAADHLDRAESRVRSELEMSEFRSLQERLVMLEASADINADLPPLRSLVERPRPRTGGARGKIGVVLPLTGEFASFGEQSLRGLLLAADSFEADPEASPDAASRAGPAAQREVPPVAAPPAARGAMPAREPDWTGGSVDFDGVVEPKEIRLIVRDTGGDAVRAAAMVRELAEDPEIVAIVGPIFTAESLAAAEAAEVSGIPLIALSHREEVPVGRDLVFRTRTTPGDEVGVLVNHAFETLGAKRFAVLYPQNRYGRGMRKLYWDAVTERGGKMVAASSYDPSATDFSKVIRDMIGYRFLSDLERKALAEREEILRAARLLEPLDAALLRDAAYGILGPDLQPLPPIVDFDVLFIPDAANKVSLIAPGLAFHEIRGVGLLGSSEWLDDELLRVARQHVAGSVISTPFYPQSDLPFVEEFVSAFRATFGDEPDSYAAQAFDAGNLVLVQLAAGRVDREDVRDGLLKVRAYPGATGVLTMRPDGNARRRPFLLGVKGRRFMPLD
jgi:ABC-type branched-subunit amino acid transport system substrate-binding protein